MSYEEPGVYIDLLGDGSLIVESSTGEVIEQRGGDRLGIVAQRRHDAKVQLKAWEETVANYDRVLLASGVTGAFGGVVINRRQRNYADTDTQSFAEYVAGEELKPDELEQVIGAAKGFKRDHLPPAVLPFFDGCTQVKATKPWIDSAVVRQQAPAMHVIQRDDDELETALAQSIADARAQRAGG